MTIPFCFYEQKSNKKASKSATAIRTISARLRQSSTELEELGEDPLSSDYDTKSKYREKLMALSGVDILEADQETYKSTTQILRELAAAWDEISDIDKSSIVYMTAGVRQTNVFNSLMTQWSEAEKVLETTANAEGAMAKAYESYTDSIEGRMNTLIATFQDLSMTVLDSELIKGVIAGTTEIVDLIDTLIEELGLLGPALAGVGIYQFIQSVGGAKMIALLSAPTYVPVVTRNEYAA